jgi:Fe(3+) dicitrate transport protein
VTPIDLGQLTATLLQPFVDPASRTWWFALVVAVAVAAAVQRPREAGLIEAILPARVYGHRSNSLDVQLLLGRQFLGLIFAAVSLGGSWEIATHFGRWLNSTFGLLALGTPPAVASIGYALTLFVVWDASRFAVHWLMHRIPVLWAFHQVHHSAEVLTPLTFHRVHPIESLLYQARGVVVTGVLGGLFFWLFRGAAADLTVLGVHALGLICNVAHGNLRHSHVWLRFPPTIERWLVSPAQHQIHHSIDPHAHGSNYGTWLSIWDRMLGTLTLSTSSPVEAFGVPSDERNHGNDLISAWLGPFLALGRRWIPGALLLLSWSAEAQEPPSEDAHDDAAISIIVFSEDGTPRVTGSTQVIGAEELELYEADDIHKVLQTATGTYVRDEDGFGLRPNIGIRGANSDRSAKITLLEDGIPLAPAPYAAPAAYYFPMSTRLVGVEIFKGPAAVQHGPQTIGGAINLLTRPIPTSPDGAIDIAYGQRNTSKIHVWGGAPGLLLEGVRRASAGFKELDTGGPTGFERSEIMAKLGTQDLQAKLGYAQESSNETYLGLHVDDYALTPYRRYAASAKGYMNWRRTQAELAWNARIGPGFSARTVAYHHYLTRAWTKLNRFADGPDLHTLLQQPEGGQSAVFLGILRGEEDTVTDDQALMIGTNNRNFHAGGLQHRGRWRHDNGGLINSAFEYGVRLHLDRVDRRHDEAPFSMISGDLERANGDRLILLDSHAEANALAAHVQEDVGVGALHLVPGLRVESIQTRLDTEGAKSDPAVTRTIGLPALGFLVDVVDGVDLFGGAYRGFSPVSPGQEIDVKPERAWNFEMGTRLGGASQTRAEAAAFASAYDNITGQCTLSGGCTGDQLDQQFNGGAVTVWGVEGLMDHEILLPQSISVPLSGTWTWTQSRFQTAFVSSFPQYGVVEIGDRLPYVPEHQGSVRIGLEHPRLRLGLSGAFRSEMDDVAGGDGFEDAPAIPSLFTLDAAVDGQLTRHVALYGTATNLTGNQSLVSWRPFGARPTAPFQLMVGIKLTPR